ncbi:hypothetical protein CVT26_007902 [Gymnopilus dilepis]|uniref:F-box domain-containing protein n=1 Tax=Gymnopilus dilepis TaxID=231916 RepID=A0A409YK94_9AGAR|nr:hypothetical protein CVT26_007902 [Gymnopilus dilepis]
MAFDLCSKAQEASSRLVSVNCMENEPSSGQDPFRHASATSFDSLPVEIISIIFIDYLEGVTCFGPRTALKLGKVCRRWREIAWSTPELWTDLTMHPRHATSRTHVELAEEWLCRSGTRLLAIKFSCHRDDWDCPWKAVLDGCEQMLEVLGRHSDRWCSVTLDVPSSHLEGFRALSGPLSALHHLSLTAAWEDYEDFRVPDYPRIAAFSKSAPRTVKLSCIKVDLDWRLVTKLTLDFVDIAEILHIFQTASSLIECTLEEVSDHGSDYSSAVRCGLIVCPMLETLTVCFYDEYSSEVFCSAVSLPILNTLSIQGHDSMLFMEDLILFLTQSSCALKCLIINESDYEQHSFADLALHLPSLTDLHILFSGRYVDNETFYHALADPSRLQPQFLPFPSLTLQPCLPCLETFKWEGSCPFPWETLPGLLKPVVNNSVAYRRPLKHVKVDCKFDTTIYPIPYIPKEVLRQLVEFVSFDSLPVEVVSIIFLHHVQEHPHCVSTPLRLGKICRRWRLIAWSTPNLWTRLTIWGKHVISQTHVELAEEWLGRSGMLPLTIELNTRRCDWNCTWDVVLQGCKQMLEVFGRYSQCWYSLTLNVHSALLEGLGTMSRPPLALQELCLTATWSNYDVFQVPDYPRLLTFSKSSPKIVELYCINVELDWKLVTRLTLSYADIAEVLHIFQTALNLYECDLGEIADYGSRFSGIMERDVIVCPALTSLKVCFSDENSSKTFCGAISFPALQHFSFRELDYAPNSFADLALRLSSVTDLHISYSDFLIETETFCHLLANSSLLQSRLLPNLEKFHWEGYAPFPWETLPRIIRPVADNVASYQRPLKHIEVDCKVDTNGVSFIPHIPKEVLRQLSEFTDVKFELTMNSNSHGHLQELDLWKESLEWEQWRSSASLE